MIKTSKKAIRIVLEDAMLIAVTKLNLTPSKKTNKVIAKAAKESAKHLKRDLMDRLNKIKPKKTAGKKKKKKTLEKAKAPGVQIKK